MAEVDDFLAEIQPIVREADVAFHHGDPKPRMNLWSHEDPVTFYGANVTRSGWKELEPTFNQISSMFTHAGKYEVEVVGVGVSGDLAYIVSKEHETTTVTGGSSETYTLRATTIFRREDGRWRQVHRHADPDPENPDSVTARRQLDRLDEAGLK